MLFDINFDIICMDGDIIKKISLIIILLFISACNVERVNYSYIDQIDFILNDVKVSQNHSGKGYKLFLPKDVRVYQRDDYLTTLYSNGTYYYLFVDILSFYYSEDVIYEENNDSYFSLELQNGYIEINKIDDKFLVEMTYNYGKIEAYVNYHLIGDTIKHFSYILGSIEFNENVVNVIVNDDLLTLEEERLSIFEPRRREGNFLHYRKEYDSYDDINIQTDDFFQIEEMFE